jgi:3-deoxy-D-manno-octulosonate 8-phosphate phosphatase (KDO 8-P phosphatase)
MLMKKARAIELVIFDVDGVLTDGSILLFSNALEAKSFHTQDGFGIKMLLAAGIEVALITAKQSEVVTLRANHLGIRHVYQNYDHKIEAYDHLLKKLQGTDAKTAYVGDDYLDIPLIRRAHLGIAVANANAFVKKQASYITKASGGHGAAREVCELVLQAQGKLTEIQRSFLC